MSDITKLVPVPPKDSINGNVHSCPTSELLRRYGYPRSWATIGSKCAQPTTPFWTQRMITADVGPFKVTGHRMAVDLLQETMLALEAKHPEVYAVIGTAGMLCVRWVRGTNSVLSNHGLGLAIDFTLEGKLDVRGDNMVQAGLLDVYSVFKNFGWFWGAEYRVEDSHHFEVGAETVRKWILSGKF